MAIGITRNTTVIGIKEEVTEGTYLAPAAATDYIQPLADGFELSPSKELIERNVLTSSIGKVSPRVGQKSVGASLPVEYRASGVEGSPTDFDLLLKGALGARHDITTQTTSKAAVHTSTLIQIEDADISKFAIGDGLVVLETGAHHVCAVVSRVTTPGNASITVTPAKPSGIFTSAVVISKSATYYPANDSHPSLSLSYYWGNQIRETAVGCKVTQLSVDNFTTGQIASFNFALEGLSFDEIDGAAPHTPTFDSGLPPLILRACLFQDGVEYQINNFSLTVANTLGFLTSTCSANGKISSRVTERAISGSFNPYKDDTSVAQFTSFNTNAPYSLLVRAFNPSTVSGEVDLGSVIVLYMPNCLTVEKQVGDQDGILTEDISFNATRGTSGSVEELYIGMV